jgi:myo-inositol 2-dehydrogenase / D-chiro-inositol 1-dehydrogenase
MKRTTIGIIGAGRIGKLHTENIIKNFHHVTIKSISDPFLDMEWAKSIHIKNLLTDHQSILDDDDIEAVMICSPSPTHASLIVEAADRGKHIFCEKPIALVPDTIKHAIAAVEKKQVKLQVGFNRRFDPNFAQVKEHILSGAIGTPHIIKITSRDPAPPDPAYIEESGGIFLDMTIHDFDMARFLADSEVVEVFARGAVMIDPRIGEQGDVDTAVVILTFEGGTIAVIDNSRKAAYGYDQRVEVFGSKGCTYAENNRLTNTVLLTETGVQTDKPLYFFLERYKEAFRAEMAAFFSAITSDQPSPVNGYDGLMPVLIGLAAKQSIVENRPIRLDKV